MLRRKILPMVVHALLNNKGFLLQDEYVFGHSYQKQEKLIKKIVQESKVVKKY